MPGFRFAEDPPRQVARYTISGRGALVLDSSEWGARSGLVSVERIVPEASPPEYWNFRVPSPRTFWGFCQGVSLDTVLWTKPLEYQRQSILQWDNWQALQYNHLLCTLQTSQLLQYVEALDKQEPDTFLGWFVDLLASLVPPSGVRDKLLEYIDVGEPCPPEKRFEAFYGEVVQAARLPGRPESAIWYDLSEGYTALIRVETIGYPLGCNDVVSVVSRPAEGPQKDEGRDSPGGGGEQPPLPPPPSRGSDPNADVPSPRDRGVPPVAPTPGEPGEPVLSGRVRVTWGGGAFLLDSCVNEAFGPVVIEVDLPSPGAAIAVGTGGLGPLYSVCGVEVNDRTFFLTVDGVPVGQGYGPAKFTSFPQLISVVQL